MHFGRSVPNLSLSPGWFGLVADAVHQGDGKAGGRPESTSTAPASSHLGAARSVAQLERSVSSGISGGSRGRTKGLRHPVFAAHSPPPTGLARPRYELVRANQTGHQQTASGCCRNDGGASESVKMSDWCLNEAPSLGSLRDNPGNNTQRLARFPESGFPPSCRSSSRPAPLSFSSRSGC